MIGSFGTLHYDVDRIVRIGITTQSNTGNTRGTNTPFAAEFGYDFAMPVGKPALIPNMP